MHLSSVEADSYEPMDEDDASAGQVHWLSRGDDSPLVSGIWRALPGEVPAAFVYDYPMHETIHVLEGSVDIEFMDGETIRLAVGDIHAVERGTRCVWRVSPETTFRKLFVCH